MATEAASGIVALPVRARADDGRLKRIIGFFGLFPPG
jgi:hypothetical protein